MIWEQNKMLMIMDQHDMDRWWVVVFFIIWQGYPNGCCGKDNVVKGHENDVNKNDKFQTISTLQSHLRVSVSHIQFYMKIIKVESAWQLGHFSQSSFDVCATMTNSTVVSISQMSIGGLCR